MTEAGSNDETQPRPYRRGTRLRRFHEERERLAEFRALLPQLTPLAWVTPLAIAICVLVFAVMVASGVSAWRPTSNDLLAWGADYGPLLTMMEPWRLLTSTFVHIGAIHLALNMLGLWVLGRLAERLFGSVALAVVFLLSGVAASLASVWWSPQHLSCGASGAVFGIGGALIASWLAHGKRIPRQIFFPSPSVAGWLFNPMAFGPIMFVVVNLYLGFTSDIVDNAAHIGGLVVGFATGLCLIRPLEVGVQRPAWRHAAALGIAALVVGAGIAMRRGAQVDGRLELALLLAQRGEHEQALLVCDEALELDPANAHALAVRGSCLVGLRRFEEALLSLDRAVRQNPNDAWAQCNLGSCLAELGRWDEAVLAFDRAIRIDPDYGWAHGRRGWCLGSLGRFESGEQSLHRAVDIDPNDGWVHGNRAWCLGELGRNEEALQAIDRALRLDPNDGWAHGKRGVFLAALGRNDEALASLQRAIERSPDTVWMLVQQATVLGNLSRRDEAMRAVQRALELAPDDVHAVAARLLLELQGSSGR
ncbi:MAG: rhomboid family intramembrane serine protease [Planctomycetota bacterium]